MTPSPQPDRVSLWPDLIRVKAGPGAPRAAVRAAVTMAVALGALWVLGRLDLAAYASFGAFASIYDDGTAHRWRFQARQGGLLTAAVATGALVAISPDRAWWSIPVAATWAAVAAAMSDRQRWRPPGPMFPVFAVAVSASIPSELTDLAPAVVVAAGTAGLAVLVGHVDASVRRSPPSAPVTATSPDPRRWRLHWIRCAVAVGVAGTLATLSGIGHPSWAMITAVVPLTVVTLQAQAVRGLHRAAGTLAGLVFAAGLLSVHLPVPAVIITVALLQAATELLVTRHYGLAMLCVTPLALLLGELADPQPTWPLLLDRLAETLIGVAVGMLTAWVTRARQSRPTDRR